MRFFSKIAQGISKFMQGRYGTDSLNRFLVWIWLGVAVLGLFVKSILLFLLEIVLCVVVFYRMLSKNFVKRRRENAAWYDFSQKIKASFQRLAVRIRDRKVARFFKCPKCKAPMRMPRKTGKFNIRCTKCGHQFKKEFK